MVKTIKLIGILEYMDAIEEVMSVEEYIEKATEKGYKVGVERMPGGTMTGGTMTTMKIYKETDYKKEER